MSRSIQAQVKREGNIVTVEGFATNVGIKSITWSNDYQGIMIEYYNDRDQTTRQYIYKENYGKTDETKLKIRQYQINAFASLCQLILPELKLVDTNDIEVAYGEYVSQIADLLPSSCDGELKLVFKPIDKKLEGKFYNFRPSSDSPVYSNSEKTKLRFTDNDKAFMNFTIKEEEAVPDVEESAPITPEIDNTSLF